MDKRVDEKKKTIPLSLVLVVLLVVLVVSALVSITFGNANLSVDKVYSVVGYELFHLDTLASFAQGAVHDIVWIIRFPRVLMAIAVGMGLAVCGGAMQAIVKNPLADPYILGVSSGASLGATLAILFGIGSLFGANFVGVMAFVGAVITSFLVLFIANVKGNANTAKLVLAGLAISSISSAFASFAIYLAHNNNATAEVMFWTMGSLGGAKWHNVGIVMLVMVAGGFFFWSQYRHLNVMLLGDETALTLGTNLSVLRNRYVVVIALMIGFSVYAAGTIGFVGLIIPHAVRMLFGSNYRQVVPISALVGSIFLIWADVLSRVLLAHSEIPIGILISLIGAPSFIYLMLKHTYGKESV